MNARLLAACLAITIVSAARSAPAPKSGGEDETPYKSAKVGDTATFKISTKVAGQNIDGTMTQTVTAKTDKEMTIKMATKMTVMGMDLPTPEQESKIDLTKPFDPLTGGLMGANGGGAAAKPMVEKLKEGKEKIKLAGKDYEAAWTTYKVNLPAGAGMNVDAEMKVWTSPKFAFHTLKMEMTADIAGMKMEMTMELAEAGTKEK
ncbi:MAG TPA: hypothetical protein VHR66_06750 [Gemmataceae bacterium]|jgi:hypothetical protein|nr:hypothetical protein [Gemmataceae bacterium]